MTCTYCGANLTIPEDLRIKAKPAVTVKPPPTRPAPGFGKEAPELMRKAQPIALKAWNAYAIWTWLRWIIPACLVMILVGLIICSILGMLPFVLSR